jgi:hypothetical protein
MNLKDLQDYIHGQKDKANDVSRQLAFAGMALVWVLKQEKQNFADLPPLLIWALGFLALTLLFDLSQYTYLTFYWKRFHSKKEDELKRDKTIDFPLPVRPSKISYWLLGLKIGSVLVGYAFILRYLANLLFCKG